MNMSDIRTGQDHIQQSPRLDEKSAVRRQAENSMPAEGLGISLVKEDYHRTGSPEKENASAEAHHLSEPPESQAQSSVSETQAQLQYPAEFPESQAQLQRPSDSSESQTQHPTAASGAQAESVPQPVRHAPPPESLTELQAAMSEIVKWEKEQKDLWFFEKIGRLPFMLLDKLTPKFLQQKIGQALDEVGGFVQNGGRYLISEREVLRKLQAESLQGAAALPLLQMNKAADELTQSRKSMATMQGATTGFGGIFTLAVDVPALLGLSLKIIQEIAICYGYDPKLKEERVFAVKCLQFASSDIVGKRAILEELALFGRRESHTQMASQLQGWREVITTYRDNFGWKKLFQMIPVAGMLFGAFINRGTLQDVAEAATMLYRKRRVLERIDQLT